MCKYNQMCNAVAALHSFGYAHRDIKPHNVLLKTRHVQAKNKSNSGDSASAAMLTSIPEAGDEESGIDEDQVQKSLPVMRLPEFLSIL